jgi:hypothetical protein
MFLGTRVFLRLQYTAMKVRQLPEPSSAPSFGISAYLHMKSQKLTIEFLAGFLTANILAVTRSFVNQILEPCGRNVQGFNLQPFS